jgi:hypothetical protein
VRPGVTIFFFCVAKFAFAQPEKWPTALEADVKSGSWAAAERVGEALVQEIDAGRMFASFSEASQEAKIRNLFAEALDSNQEFEEARAQRCLARQIVDPRPDAACAARAALQRDRRIVQLKASVLASEVKIPASFPFPRPGGIAIIAFSAAWCAPCVKELDELRKFKNPLAQIVVLDVDQLSSAQKASFLPMPSLLGPEVPRLYVLDRESDIRFHVAGFEDDGFFAQKLDWMIEAIASR